METKHSYSDKYLNAREMRYFGTGVRFQIAYQVSESFCEESLYFIEHL
jgi:hypothetical protein